jgi:plastocyanin
MKVDAGQLDPWRKRMRTMALLAILLAATGACGGDSGGGHTGPPDPTPPAGSNTVTVGNNFFTPTSLTIATGATVTWQWASGAVTHNVTFDDGVHSEDQSSGSFARTFSAAGTFPYHCTIHGAQAMHGTVTVSASDASGGGGSGGGGGGYDYLVR